MSRKIYKTPEEAREARLRKTREWRLAHADYVRAYANSKYRHDECFREKSKRDALARYYRNKERAANAVLKKFPTLEGVECTFNN